MQARFNQGSIAIHLITMTLTGAVGLVTTFLVDFVDIFFINLLAKPAMIAGIGYAGSITFFIRSIALALGIATGILVARQMGRGNLKNAKRFALHSTLLACFLVLLLSTLVYWQQKYLLNSVKATGEALIYAQQYLNITLVSNLFFALGICGNQILRALGEGSASMKTSLYAALLNGLLDPIFIFLFEWDIRGAALATLASYMVLSLSSWLIIIYQMKMLDLSQWKRFPKDINPIIKMATPAMLSNMAAPIISIFMIRQIADFGTDATAGLTVIMRFFPLIAALMFALSGAIAPIVGQNAGAKQYHRVRQAIWHAFWFNWLMTITMTILLFISRDFFINMFKLEGEGKKLLEIFTSPWILLMGFDGMIFFILASFNNLARPFLSTLCNFARVICGAIPFILIGKALFGASGALIGYLGENAIVSLVAFYFLLKLTKKIEKSNV